MTVAETASSAGQLAAPTTRRLEVLAPAGDWDCLRAAIENGADAVYFGLQGHNARARAANFQADELETIFTTLHRRGVRGYVTVNTLVFPRELPDIEQLLRRIAAAGADAIIVQDPAVIRIARALCPDLAIHASTQMTLTSAETIRFVEQMGVQRVVLARELSLEEIALIRQKTRMPLEVFVHGALCVAYSGQCLTSEALGGRSANRGQCAQACRLPYEVISDGKPVDLQDIQYLLSPQDLAAYALVPDLLRMGITSLKIEGRLKSAEYVANITRHYRRAVDAALAEQASPFTPEDRYEMEMSFSRGFTPGWLEGNDHKRLVNGRCPKKRGIFLGEVLSVGFSRIRVRLTAPLKRGDGVVFEEATEAAEQGGRVYELFVKGNSLEEVATGGAVDLAFGRESLRLEQIREGQRLWKTDDPALNRRLRQTFAREAQSRRVPLSLQIEAEVGRPLRVLATATNGAQTEVASAAPLAAATRHPLTVEVLREQFGRLGNSVYALEQVDAQITGQPMAPLSVLGQMRKQLLAQLEAFHSGPAERAIAAEAVVPALRKTIEQRSTAEIDSVAEGSPRLHVLCRTLPQIDAALQAGIRHLYADFQDIREYPEAVERVRAAGGELFLATPRIQKPKEAPLFRYLTRSRPQGVLVRNLAALLYFVREKLPVVADFSLNTANELTAQLYREKGALRVTASYDLNREQLTDLAAATPPGWLEVVVHQHMPMFHMEHCVFCAVLSPGTNRTNCGRPCDRHLVELRDRVGMAHPLKADVGCRNTLFNAVPQSAAEAVTPLLRSGVRDFRIELLDHTPEQVAATVQLYGDLLAGRIEGPQVWSTLRANNTIGVTRGPLGT